MGEEINFTANGIEFTVGEVPFGPHAGKWVWSTKDDEGKPYGSAVEAQQDALQYAREPETATFDEDESRHGTYEQQVRSLYYDTQF